MYFNPSRQSRPFSFRTGAAAAVLLVIVMTLSSCGGQSPTCDSEGICLRYWVRNVIAVSVELSADYSSESLDYSPNITTKQLTSLPTEVESTLSAQRQGIKGLSPYTGDGLPAMTVTVHTATVFFALQPSSTDSASDQNLIHMVNQINSQPPILVHDETPPNPVVGTIRGASPDWVTGAAQAGDHATGSPGGPPRSTTGKMPTLSSPVNSSTNPVYLLDTAYGTSGGQASPTNCAIGAWQTQCLPQVQSWQGPRTGPVPANLKISQLGLYEDRGQNGHQPPYEFIGGSHNPQNIRDHGVFSVGILHEIAPQAPIRLIRVLNNFGVGSLKEVLFALQTIICTPGQLNVGDVASLCGLAPHTLLNDYSKISPSPRGVINLSLTIGVPVDCLGLVWLQGVLPKDPDASTPCGTPQPQISSFTPSPFLSNLFAPAGLPLDDLAREGYTIVAAAGNDSTQLGGSHADADMPAAFCSVIAVAATQGTSQSSGLATFSNNPYIDDVRTKQPACIAVSVGRVNQGQLEDWNPPYAGEQALGKNVCSLFPTTSSGLALWDGTSFATAVVSANVLQDGTVRQSLTEPKPCG